MKFRDFVRETRFRTLGLDGIRLVGAGLIVPSEIPSIDDWEATDNQTSCPDAEPELKFEDRMLTRE